MTNVTSCSLGPGSEVGGNDKKQASKGKISASQAVAYGGGKGVRNLLETYLSCRRSCCDWSIVFTLTGSRCC